MAHWLQPEYHNIAGENKKVQIKNVLKTYTEILFKMHSEVAIKYPLKSNQNINTMSNHRYVNHIFWISLPPHT